MTKSQMASRRDILKMGSTLAAVGASTQLGLFSAASATTAAAGGYKALVCISLRGGNDSYNTLIPADGYHHKLYKAARPDSFVERSDLAGTRIQPGAGWQDGRQMAFHPALKPLKSLFDSGDLTMALNVGPLVEPVSRKDVERGRNIPQGLFEHAQQVGLWNGVETAGATSWGNRLSETFANQVSVCDSFQAFSAVGRTPFFGANYSDRITFAYPTNEFANEVDAVACKALSRSGSVKQARTMDSNASALHGQLSLVAGQIAKAAQNGDGRQLYFCELGGFDTHGKAAQKHDTLLATLADAMTSFQAELEAQGIAENVVTFTTSEFGRSLNMDGLNSDHGWGGHHFVMGKAVKPRKILGVLPTYEAKAPDDAGNGRLVPSISVDQYAGMFAQWMGLGRAELAQVYPNIGRFDSLSSLLV